jgi:hypothetical protein
LLGSWIDQRIGDLFPKWRSPDRQFYLWSAEGFHVPRPYALRWLPGFVLGPRKEHWLWCTVLCAVGSALVLGSELGPWAGIWFLCLPVVRTWICCRALVDPPGFFFALVSWGLLRQGQIEGAVAAAILAGGCRETAPVFAALWSWSPWPLLGLIAVGWWRPRAGATVLALRAPHLAWNAFGLTGPYAVLFGSGPSFWATLGAAWGQTFIATDDQRLLSWAAPVIWAVCPPGLYPLLALSGLTVRAKP